MGRTLLLARARARIEDLNTRIEIAQYQKKKLIKYLQELKDKYLDREITYSEYEEIVSQKRDGKTTKEWIEYYDSYIGDCEDRIEKEKGKIIKKKIMFTFFSLLFGFILIFALFYTTGPTLIGLIVQEQKQEFTQDLNLKLSTSTDYEWQLDNLGTLDSVKISGLIEGDGQVKIYLDDLLILDSDYIKGKKVKKGKGITGQTIAIEEEKGFLAFFKNFLGFFGLVGRTVEELPEETVEETESEEESEESSSEETQEEAPPEDLSPSQEEPSSSETEEEIPEQELEESEEVEEEQEKIIPEEEIEEELPEEEPSEEVEEELSAESKKEIEIIIKEFSDICEQTCDLGKLGLNKDSYTLRIEIKNAKLNLDKIKYEIITEEIPKEEEVPEEEIIEEEEEKPKEEIIPEIPTPKENITEEIPENITIPEEEENITEIPEINITNITKPPYLLKQIPDREIQKNTYGIININDFFFGAEQFFLLQVKNITTTTYDHRIKLVPDNEFLGTRTIKIIASNEFGTAESNFFNVTVSEFVSSPELLKDIPDIYILKNNFTEIDITKYFAGAEQYFLLQTKNISTTTYDHIIKLEPDQEFLGIRTSKVIAVNALGLTESNFFDVIISEEIIPIPVPEVPVNITIPREVNISTLQYKAVINRPQKWIKVIEAGKVEDIEGLVVELPKEAENITVKTGLEVQEALLELEEYEDLIEQANKEDLISGGITGNVALDIKSSQGIFTRLGKWLRGFTVTGNVIQEEDLQEEITETVDGKIIDIGDIALQTNENKIAVEYYTAGPTAVEETTKRGKKITISATDELNYTEILAFTELTEEVATKQIRLYRTTDGIREQTEFTSYDLNNNGLIDYIEWLVPHLSEQTYELEIVIIDAEHLDENKQFIANIFEYVNTTDGITYTIPENQYARAYFERNLTNENVIDIFVRNTQPATIEVYEKDSDIVIGIIEDVTQGIYFITLNHPGSQSIFDLKSIGNEVIYDYIHDQPEQVFFEACTDGTDITGVWTVTGTADNLWQEGGGGNNNKCWAENGFSNMTIITAIDLTGVISANLTFDRNCDNLEGGDHLRAYVNSSVEDWQLLLDTANNDPITEEFDLSNNITMTTGVYIRFELDVTANNEDCTLDNINVTSLSADTAPPLVTINVPENTTYSDSHMPLNFNVTLNENGSVMYSLNDGVDNITMTGDGGGLFGTDFNATNSSIADGGYTFSVYANDTLGNNNYTESVIFSVDQTIPTVNFTFSTPANGSSQDNTDIFVNISSSDASDHYAFVDFDNDVFLWMTMEESDGSVTDFSSYSNNGTFIGDAFQNTSGRFGFASQFDGVDETPPDAINISSLASSLRFNESFTVSVWVKTETIIRADITGTRNTLTTGPGWSIGINQQDKALFTANDTIDLETTTSPDVITAGEWVHIVGVYNKSTPSLQIYLNGTLQDTQTATASTLGYANNQDFRIGMTDATGRIWNGLIDEVMLFNRSLAGNEISALYNASANQYSHNFTGLSAIEHIFTGYAVDVYGNKNQTEDRSVTISAGDTLAPDVTINFPENLTYGNNDLPLNFNVTLSENGSVMYSLDDGIHNITMLSADEGQSVFGTLFNSTNDSIADGGYTFSVYANDTVGNNNYTESIAFTFLDRGRSACDTLDTTGTTYILLRNITITTSGTCFQVTADDIILDGDGDNMYSVTGNNTVGDFGINATGRANFTLWNINVTNFSMSVSVAGVGSTSSNPGGDLIVINSTLENIDVSGRNSLSGEAGNSGNISIFESNVTNITATGGFCPSLCPASTGGAGGNVIFENTDINLSNGLINITQGNPSNTPGTLTLNYSGFFEDLNVNYGNNLYLIIINSSLGGIGEIKWIPTVGSKITNLSINTEIRNNSAFVNSTALSGLNVTANITFFNMPGTFTDPVILINSTSTCDTKTSSSCSNFTSLNAATVIFNVSAWDVFNYSIGENPSANAAPTIILVFNHSEIGGTLNEGPSNTNFTVNFSVTDTDGVADLDSTTAAVNFSKSGEDTRYNVTCAQYESAGNNANYTCEVMMWWWDGSGTWDINASITDSASNDANNDTQTFQVSATTGFVMAPGNLTFPSITAGGTNFTSDNDPLLLNNTGNVDIAQTDISINATSLVGEITTTLALYSGNFSVGNTTGGNAECASGLSTQMNYTVSGGSFVNITNAVMNASNFTINNGREGQEQLYFCLRLAGPELTQQAYSTITNGAWTVQILSIAVWIKVLFANGVGSGILLVAVISTRKRKKRKTISEKSIKDDKLVKSLALIIEEIREKYSLNEAEIMKLVVKELREKYKISEQEITKILGIEKKANIPTSIFSKELGGLEALVKYMKENLGMSYREISKELNRDERTIWTAYKKASEKKKELIEVKKTDILFSIYIFKDRKLTVLESIIVHLRERGMKYSGIAKLLDRDQRNIQTIYSRATKKLHENE